MRKEKAVIWGVGGTARQFIDMRGYYRNYEIVAFVDSNPIYSGLFFQDKKILHPKELYSVDFDVLIIASRFEKEIRGQIEKMGINAQVISVNEIRERIKELLIKTNNNRIDEDIKEAISYYKQNDLNIFSNYNPVTEKYYIERNEFGEPYVWFEGKKMFLPENTRFGKDAFGEYYADIMYEQKEGSPHLYIRCDEDIPVGGVIVDAGTCEGNFALKYIERVSKVYLIEPNRAWMEALKRSFAPYKDKVVFCNKFLGRYNSHDTITLDILVDENIDFIKMDIEGAEIDALLGAKGTLKVSNCRCAICSYHKQNDEENIEFILNNLGYETEVSKGVMFFEYDEDIVDTLDFRHGVVYAYKHSKQ